MDMKYTKSIVNLGPKSLLNVNEWQLDSNRSFESKQFRSFSNRIDFTSSLAHFNGKTIIYTQMNLNL